MTKIDSWFQTLNQKLEQVGQDVLAVRGELSDIRDFIEQHQTDIRLCKLAIERVDEKFENLSKPHP
jgi:hypothetical protein